MKSNEKKFLELRTHEKRSSWNSGLRHVFMSSWNIELMRKRVLAIILELMSS